MKKIISAGTTLALLMAAGSAFADNSLNSGTMGLNVGLTGGPMISGKFFMAKDMAVQAGFGLQHNSVGGTSTTAYQLMGGVRKYLKTEDFAPFVGGNLSYSNDGATNATSNFGVTAEAGAEYFLNKRFSLEGSVGVSYVSSSTSLGGGLTATASSLSTATYGLSANFYF